MFQNSLRGPLTRSTDGLVGGVCAGLATHFGLSPTLLRLAWLAAVLFFGTGFLAYIALWMIVPRADRIPLEPTIWRRGTNGRHSAPLQRTNRDRMFMGVCGGIARARDLDPSYVRLAVLSLSALSFGLVALAYLAAGLILPSADAPMLRRSSSPVEF